MGKEKIILVHGAICKCQFGTTPDILQVKTQKKHYANDNTASQQLIATDREIEQAFLAGTFGSCKMMNNNPCKSVISQWINFYDKVTLSNGGKILTNESKAICPMGGGSPCIEVVHHGQQAVPSAENMVKAKEEIHSQINPFLNPATSAEHDLFEGVVIVAVDI